MIAGPDTTTGLGTTTCHGTIIRIMADHTDTDIMDPTVLIVHPRYIMVHNWD